jgi:anti-sigma factor RsiW
MNEPDKATHELLSAYLDGELSCDEQARVEHLLSADESQQAVLEGLRSVQGEMRQLPHHQLDDQFAIRVLDAARAADAGPPAARPVERRDWAGPLAAAVVFAAAAVLLASFLLFAPTDRQPNGLAPTKSVAQNDAATTASESRRSSAVTPLDQADATTPPVEVPATSTASVEADPHHADPSVARPPIDKIATPDEPAGNVSSDQGRNMAAVPDPENGSSLPTDASAPTTRLGPGRMSQKILLVMDVSLTESGAESSRFERLLRNTGVAFDASIRVEKDLEDSLLASRYFQPADAPPEASSPAPPVSVVYVVSSGGAIDLLWRRMVNDEEHFAKVGLDLAIWPNDKDVFAQLRKLGEIATLNADAREPASAVAHRLELPPGCSAVPVSRAPAGPGGRPPAGADASTLRAMLGANIEAEAIFVVHHQPR